MTLDRPAILDRFARMRARTRALFDLIDEGAYLARPISLRNPVVFYEGHLPAFAVNTLIKKGLGRHGIDEHLETIFARGIDPEIEANAVARGNPAWPAREVVLAYAAAADNLIADAIAHAELERDVASATKLNASGTKLKFCPTGTEALWTILEHEEMHQETLAYMWHQLPYALKRKPEHYVTAPPRLIDRRSSGERAKIPAGTATLGTRLDEAPALSERDGHSRVEGFAWDNELPAHCVSVSDFEIDVDNVTNADYMAFVDAGGYRDERWWRPEDFAWIVEDRVSHPPFWQREDGQWFWRGMFERVPLPPMWPVYVTWAEAHAYARWRHARLPTEAEFQRAAYGTPDGRERHYPWGNSLEGRAPANFDFLRWDPDPVDVHPAAASAFGVRDLVGNGWEWTSTTFAPFPGFAPLPSYPEYSADFFDGDHFVLKGASPVTSRTLVRRGFRNWFRPRYPYVYASFRCVG